MLTVDFHISTHPYFYHVTFPVITLTCKQCVPGTISPPPPPRLGTRLTVGYTYLTSNIPIIRFLFILQARDLETLVFHLLEIFACAQFGCWWFINLFLTVQSSPLSPVISDVPCACSTSTTSVTGFRVSCGASIPLVIVKTHLSTVFTQLLC